MILMIDNYDSFTYNLVQYLRMLGRQVLVRRNDELVPDDLEKLVPEAIVISPGPGRPSSAGVCLEIVRLFSGRLPILGVCLGHQVIARAFGARIVQANRLMHGKTSQVTADGKGVFRSIDRPFTAMRYHSLAVEESSLPACLKVSARDEEGQIMGLRHAEHPTEGIQFHPESIMTSVGKRILRNFIELAAQNT